MVASCQLWVLRHWLLGSHLTYSATGKASAYSNEFFVLLGTSVRVATTCIPFYHVMWSEVVRRVLFQFFVLDFLCVFFHVQQRGIERKTVHTISLARPLTLLHLIYLVSGALHPHISQLTRRNTLTLQEIGNHKNKENLNEMMKNKNAR